MKTLHNFNEVFDSQAVFRKILEGMSNPGRVVSVAEQKDKMFGDNGAMLALAMTLLDNEVSFYVCGSSSLSEELELITLAGKADVCDADFIFVAEEKMLEAAISSAKCGTLSDPHKSATLLIHDTGEKTHSITLYGPGINGFAEYRCSETVCHAIALRDARQYEYPMGIDMIFVTDDGNVTCIPRLVRRRDS